MNFAKEKADELFNKYYQLCADSSYPDSMAKQCALIAVDEIYNEIDDNYDTLHSSDRKQYWQEVKNEIEKI
jgi:hypothetical protein